MPPPAATPASSKVVPARRLGVMARQIEQALGTKVLPRLTELRQPVDVAEVERLTAIAARGDAAALAASFTDRKAAGQTSESLCLILLTLVARRLGEWWAEDRCTFVEVTLGTILLHEQLHQLAPGLPQGRVGGAGRSALMLPAIGNQHSLGISMVAEFFRAAGWTVAHDRIGDVESLASRVAEQWFGVVAISVGAVERLPVLTTSIRAIRAHSLNRDIVVMLGGPALTLDPGLAAAAGADATAPDAAEALRQAEALIRLSATPA